MHSRGSADAWRIGFVVFFVSLLWFFVTVTVCGKECTFVQNRKLQRRTPRRKKRTEGSPSWIELQGVILFYRIFFSQNNVHPDLCLFSFVRDCTHGYT